MFGVTVTERFEDNLVRDTTVKREWIKMVQKLVFHKFAVFFFFGDPE